MRHRAVWLAAALILSATFAKCEVHSKTVMDFSAGIGGLSAVSLSEDGRRFVMVNDRGNLVVGQMVRDENDDLMEINAAGVRALAGFNGLALGQDMADPEGIDWDGGEEIFLSFEGRERVVRYDIDGTALDLMPAPPEFAHFHPNRGIEALARTPNGQLLIAPERRAPHRAPLYALTPDGWIEVADLRQLSPLSPVGMDVGPDGLLYVLFRGVGLFGFSSTIAVIDLGSGESEVLINTPAGKMGNLEGISVWRDTQGGLRLTLVADDNQIELFQGGVVEYVITPPLQPPLDERASRP